MTGNPIYYFADDGTWQRPDTLRVIPSGENDSDLSVTWASDFYNTMSVAAHLNRSGVYSDGWNSGDLQNAFSQINLKRYRVLGETSSDLAVRVNSLASLGIKAGMVWQRPNVAQTPAVLESWAETNLDQDSISWVEGGGNEWNIGASGGGYSGWETDSRAHLLDTYNTIKGSNVSWIADLPVAGTSLGNAVGSPGDFVLLGDITDRCDWLNLHLYWARGDVGPSGLIDDQVGRARELNLGFSYIMSEMGLHNDLGGVSTHNPADETTGGYYIPVGYCEQYLRGAKVASLYELVDEPEKAHHEAHFGLYRSDWTPKPSAIALSRFVNLVSDDGQGAELQSVPGEVNGPDDLRYFWLQKTDGTILLVLWRDVKIWDWINETPVSVSNVSVDVNLYSPKNCDVWKPSQQAAVVSRHTSKTSFSITMGAGVVVVEVL